MNFRPQQFQKTNRLARLDQESVRPNVVTYTTLAQPFAGKGDYKTVEMLMRMLETDGLSPNHYSYSVRLNRFLPYTFQIIS